MNSNKHDFETS